jgi:hypothetical protein
MEEKTRFRMRTELADLYERARRARDDAQQLIDNYHRMLAWGQSTLYSSNARREMKG